VHKKQSTLLYGESLNHLKLTTWNLF